MIFWTTLETSLVSLKKSVKQNSKQIRKIENDNNILVEQIKYLGKENIDLRDRIKALEDRVWHLSVAPTTEGVVIGADNTEQASLVQLKGPNKKPSKDAPR